MTQPSVKHWQLGQTPWLGEAPILPPGVRVIIDNDFSGDPDDLYQLVHHLLSPNVDIRLIIGSHLREGDFIDPGPDTATHACRRVQDVLDAMGLDASHLIKQGAQTAMPDAASPQPSEACDAIIVEALRTDATTPLFYVAGGGLTDIASAYLTNPAIADKLTLIWIGGTEYPGLADPPPFADNPEYNYNIDPVAARLVLSASSLDLWQVPRDAYRQCLVSDIELRTKVAPMGAVGQLLYQAVRRITAHGNDRGPYATETYVLGDQPLVTFTALLSHFQPGPASSDWVTLPAPQLTADGRPQPGHGRPIRVFTRIDNRLTFEDFFTKLAAFAAWQTNA
ncbi:MAG: nucleoside hydrolase [Bifidobacteriaceae bacterium]|jgi:hypothetical protein|nr:nucleoside hydrolase [Bifidobacteriaceae bacterium]